ncbi:LOW QUALITY PROTEIN: hypothetical protein ACHAWF_013265 [Thalassiosira exigua]
MQTDDVGLMANPDEVLMQDYLRTMQTCDVKEFGGHNNCKRARMSGAMRVCFEGGSHCRNIRPYFHPDMTIGEGDQRLPLAASQTRADMERARMPGGGYMPGSGFRSLPPIATHYPLYNAHDFRRMIGRSYIDKYYYGHNVFHLHNFFPTAEVIRRKYNTYGKGGELSSNLSLGELHTDGADAELRVQRLAEPSLWVQTDKGGAGDAERSRAHCLPGGWVRRALEERIERYALVRVSIK